MGLFVIVPALIVLWMVGQHWRPWGRPVAGQVIRRESLSLLGRLRAFGRAASLGFGVLIVGTRVGWVAPTVALALAMLLLVLPALPLRYTLTTEGIARGRAGFRNWSEFGGVTRQAGGIRLGGVMGRRGMTVWLGGGRDDDDFVLLVRRMVRGSYQGSAGAGGDQPEPAAWAAPREFSGALPS